MKFLSRVDAVKSSSTKNPSDDSATGRTTPTGGDTGTDAGTDVKTGENSEVSL